MKSVTAPSIVVLILMSSLAIPLRAVAQSANQPASASPATQQPIPAASPAPRVTGLQGNLEADDLILVEIDHLAEWVAAKNDASKLIPYLNGLALRGNYPLEVHTAQNHIRYHLQITPENKNMWVNLLGAPEGTKKRIAFSIGLEGQSQFDSVFDQDHPALLTIISPVYGIVALLIVVSTLVLLIWLARNTNLIREPGPRPVGNKRRPYNLGRTQMAFWFFLIYSSYTTIWLITDALDTITASLLGLIGISAGTALSEALIDSGKTSSQVGQLQDLKAEQATLEQTIPDLQTQLTVIQAKQNMTPEDISSRDSLNKQLQDLRTRLAQVNQQVQTLSADQAPEVSSGFLRDLLSDGHGYSFHRFQIFAWTIILGVIFISSVYNQLTMPEFSATLLGLMGISSGTYLGFKFPENK